MRFAKFSGFVVLLMSLFGLTANFSSAEFTYWKKYSDYYCKSARCTGTGKGLTDKGITVLDCTWVDDGHDRNFCYTTGKECWGEVDKNDQPVYNTKCPGTYWNGPLGIWDVCTGYWQNCQQ